MNMGLYNSRLRKIFVYVAKLQKPKVNLELALWYIFDKPVSLFALQWLDRFRMNVMYDLIFTAVENSFFRFMSS